MLRKRNYVSVGRLILICVGVCLATLTVPPKVRADPFDVIRTYTDGNATTTDRFGFRVVSDTGQLLIDSWLADGVFQDEGAVSLVDVATGAVVWNFVNPTPAVGDGLGSGICFLDANVVVIGDPGDDSGGPQNAGSAYWVDRSNGNILFTVTSPARINGGGFGTSIINVNGDVLITEPQAGFGGSGPGRAHLFDGATGGLIRSFENPTPTNGDRFGWEAVAVGVNVFFSVTQDFVGANLTGSVQHFLVDGTFVRTIASPVTESLESFGASIAVANEHLLVGSPGYDGSGVPAAKTGRVYVYDVVSGVLLATIENPNAPLDDEFGHDVEFAGPHIAVGVPLEATSGSSAGAVYFFDGGSFGLIQKVLPTGATGGQRFGDQLAAHGTDILVTQSGTDEVLLLEGPSSATTFDMSIIGPSIVDVAAGEEVQLTYFVALTSSGAGGGVLGASYGVNLDFASGVALDLIGFAGTGVEGLFSSDPDTLSFSELVGTAQGVAAFALSTSSGVSLPENATTTVGALSVTLTAPATEGQDDFTVEIVSGLQGSGQPVALEVVQESGSSLPSTTPLVVTVRTLVPFVRGDLNGSGTVSLADAIALFGELFINPGPVNCADSRDFNDDGATDISDGLAILNALFTGAFTPVPPFGQCATDATADLLTCDAYDSCP